MRSVSILALLCALSAAAAEPDPPFCKIKQDNKGGGSGTLVAMGDPGWCYVLTCKHVAPDARHDYAVFTGPCSYRAEWVAADDRADLALLKIRAELACADMPARAPLSGSACETRGCPGGGELKVKTGEVGGPARVLVDGTWRDWTRFSVPIEPGDSGAGVFCGNRLVGVAAAGPAPFLMVGFDDVNRFLVRHQKIPSKVESKAAPLAQAVARRPDCPT